MAIATPVRNGARLLAETMACVQAQTYPNIVHCILDNASTDATADIMGRFANDHMPLIVARNPTPLTLHDSWNAALRLVPREASYFHILSPGDLILSQGIEKMVALGERHPEAAIIGCQEWADEILLGSELPSDRSLFDGRAIVRGSLTDAINGFPYSYGLHRKPLADLPDMFFDTECYGARLLPIQTDAAMRGLCAGAYACVHEPLVVTRRTGASARAGKAGLRHLDMWARLQLIDRWGPHAFDSDEEYRKCRTRHLRCYYRQLLLWRALRRTALLDQHLEWLKLASALPTSQDYLRAVAEWPLLRLSHSGRNLAVRAGVLSGTGRMARESALPG